MSNLEKKIRTLIAKSGEGLSSTLHGLANRIYRKTRVGPVIAEVKQRYTTESKVDAVKFYRNQKGLTIYEALEEIKRMADENGWEEPDT